MSFKNTLVKLLPYISGVNELMTHNFLTFTSTALDQVTVVMYKVVQSLWFRHGVWHRKILWKSYVMKIYKVIWEFCAGNDGNVCHWQHKILGWWYLKTLFWVLSVWDLWNWPSKGKGLSNTHKIPTHMQKYLTVQVRANIWTQIRSIQLVSWTDPM